MTVVDHLRDRARRRFRRHQEDLISSDAEWMALRDAEAARLAATTTGDHDSLDRWFQAVARRSEIENAVPWPWYEWLGRRYDGWKFLVAPLSRPRRPPSRCSRSPPEPDPTAAVEGRVQTRCLAGRRLGPPAAPPDLIDNLDWPEWQEILTFSGAPATTCLDFALGERPDGCFPECSLPRRGKVRCLAPEATPSNGYATSRPMTSDSRHRDVAEPPSISLAPPSVIEPARPPCQRRLAHPPSPGQCRLRVGADLLGELNIEAMAVRGPGPCDGHGRHWMMMGTYVRFIKATLAPAASGHGPRSLIAVIVEDRETSDT